jgi:hypothetical protein
MRAFRMIGILALALAASLSAQPGAPAPAAAQPGNDAARKPGPGGRFVNPESLAARLMLATPEQRERALALLPPARQALVRKQLEWFDGLPKAQQEMQIRRLDRFASLPPGQQAIVRLRMQAVAKLPLDRRRAIQRALIVLQTLPRGQRAARMNNPAFVSRFSPEERQIVEDLSDAWLLPPAPSGMPK